MEGIAQRGEIMVTVSGLARAEACVASETLQHHKETAGKYAAHGTEVHAFLDRICKGATRDESLALVAEPHQKTCGAIDLSLIPHSQKNAWRSEVAFAFNWRTGEGREMEVSDRQYASSLGESEIAGTADLVGIDPGGSVVVLDVKTGMKPPHPLQLLAYATAAAKAYGKTTAVVGFLFVQDGFEPRLSTQFLSESDLLGAADRIKSIMERVEFAKLFGTATPVMGDHCLYCPAMRSCPSRLALIAPSLSNSMDVARGAFGGRNEATIELRLDEVAGAYQKVKAGIDLLERLKADLELVVKSSPEGSVIQADGKVLAEVAVEVEKLDARAAREVLVEFFGAPSVDEAIETKTTLTKAAVERLVDARREKTKEKKKDLSEQVFKAIRAVGGITISGYTKIQAIKPEKLKGQHHEP